VRQRRSPGRLVVDPEDERGRKPPDRHDVLCGADQTVSAQLTGLTPGEIYDVAVVAVNSHGVWSGCSDTMSARARPS
jgi:hypothetical protein